MTMVCTVDRGRLLVRYDTESERGALRTVLGAALDHEAGGYRVPRDRRVFAALERIGVSVDGRAGDAAGAVVLEETPQDAARRLRAVATVRSAPLEWTPPDGLALYPYQEEGAASIAAHRRLLLADAPGVGKTIQVLAWLATNADVRPVLVLCPSSVRLNWCREAARWIPCAVVATWRSAAEAPARVDASAITVLSYDLAVRCETLLKRQRWAAVVYDEAHRISNTETKRGKLAISLAKTASHVVALTGTPVVNRPAELYPVLRVVAPDVFRSSWDFRLLYCGMEQRRIFAGGQPRYVWQAKGLARADELRELLSCCMLRRTKDEVLAQLPSKRRVVVDVEIDREAYDRAEDGCFARADAAPSGAAALERTGRLRREIGRAKAAAAAEWIDDFCASGESLVVFAHHREVIEALTSAIGVSWVSITGETASGDRLQRVDAFQRRDAQVMVASLRAAGEGITLTRASDVLFVERDWTAAAEEQAEDRCHRIGQERPVTAWYLRAAGTIDDEIAALVEQKRAFAGRMLDGAPDEQLTLQSDADVVCKLITERRCRSRLTTTVDAR
jgi:SNF2 family DNA or RNA helicase